MRSSFQVLHVNKVIDNDARELELFVTLIFYIIIQDALNKKLIALLSFGQKFNKLFSPGNTIVPPCFFHAVSRLVQFLSGVFCEGKIDVGLLGFGEF